MLCQEKAVLCQEKWNKYSPWEKKLHSRKLKVIKPKKENSPGPKQTCLLFGFASSSKLVYIASLIKLDCVCVYRFLWSPRLPSSVAGRALAPCSESLTSCSPVLLPRSPAADVPELWFSERLETASVQIRWLHCAKAIFLSSSDIS